MAEEVKEELFRVVVSERSVTILARLLKLLGSDSLVTKEEENAYIVKCTQVSANGLLDDPDLKIVKIEPYETCMIAINLKSN